MRRFFSGGNSSQEGTGNGGDFASPVRKTLFPIFRSTNSTSVSSRETVDVLGAAEALSNAITAIGNDTEQLKDGGLRILLALLSPPPNDDNTSQVPSVTPQPIPNLSVEDSLLTLRSRLAVDVTILGPLASTATSTLLQHRSNSGVMNTLISSPLGENLVIALFQALRMLRAWESRPDAPNWTMIAMTEQAICLHHTQSSNSVGAVVCPIVTLSSTLCGDGCRLLGAGLASQSSRNLSMSPLKGSQSELSTRVLVGATLEAVRAVCLLLVSLLSNDSMLRRLCLRSDSSGRKLTMRLFLFPIAPVPPRALHFQRFTATLVSEICHVLTPLCTNGSGMSVSGLTDDVAAVMREEKLPKDLTFALSQLIGYSRVECDTGKADTRNCTFRDDLEGNWGGLGNLTSNDDWSDESDDEEEEDISGERSSRRRGARRFGQFSPKSPLSEDSTATVQWGFPPLSDTAYWSSNEVLTGYAAECAGCWLYGLTVVMDVMSAVVVRQPGILLDFFSREAFGDVLNDLLRRCHPRRFLVTLTAIVSSLSNVCGTSYDGSSGMQPCLGDWHALGELGRWLQSLIVQLLELPRSVSCDDNFDSLQGLAASLGTASAEDRNWLNLSGRCLEENSPDSFSHRRTNQLRRIHRRSYAIQGMAHALLTLYSNNGRLCAALEEKCCLLSVLILALPALRESDAITVVLTAVNFYCDAVDTVSIGSNTGNNSNDGGNYSGVTKQPLISLCAVVAMMTSCAMDRSLPGRVRWQMVNGADLAFSSLEAVARAKYNDATMITRCGFISTVTTAPLSRLWADAMSGGNDGRSGNTGVGPDGPAIKIVTRLASFLTEIRHRAGSGIASALLAAEVHVVISGAVRCSSIGALEAELLLRFLEIAASVDEGDTSSSSSHLRRSLETLLSLASAVGGSADRLKAAKIFESLWRVVLNAEGRAGRVLGNCGMESCLLALRDLKKVFLRPPSFSSIPTSTPKSAASPLRRGNSSLHITTSSLLDQKNVASGHGPHVAELAALEAILKFACLLVSLADGEGPDASSRLAEAIVDTSVFTSIVAGEAISLLWDMVSAFSDRSQVLSGEFSNVSDSMKSLQKFHSTRGISELAALGTGSVIAHKQCIEIVAKVISHLPPAQAIRCLEGISIAALSSPAYCAALSSIGIISIFLRSLGDALHPSPLPMSIALPIECENWDLSTTVNSNRSPLLRAMTRLTEVIAIGGGGLSLEDTRAVVRYLLRPPLMTSFYPLGLMERVDGGRRLPPAVDICMCGRSHTNDQVSGMKSVGGSSTVDGDPLSVGKLCLQCFPAAGNGAHLSPIGDIPHFALAIGGASNSCSEVDFTRGVDSPPPSLAILFKDDTSLPANTFSLSAWLRISSATRNSAPPSLITIFTLVAASSSTSLTLELDAANGQLLVSLTPLGLGGGTNHKNPSGDVGEVAAFDLPMSIVAGEWWHLLLVARRTRKSFATSGLLGISIFVNGCPCEWRSSKRNVSFSGSVGGKVWGTAPNNSSNESGDYRGFTTDLLSLPSTAELRFGSVSNIDRRWSNSHLSDAVLSVGPVGVYSEQFTARMAAFLFLRGPTTGGGGLLSGGDQSSGSSSGAQNGAVHSNTNPTGGCGGVYGSGVLANNQGPDAEIIALAVRALRVVAWLSPHPVTLLTRLGAEGLLQPVPRFDIPSLPPPLVLLSAVRTSRRVTAFTASRRTPQETSGNPVVGAVCVRMRPLPVGVPNLAAHFADSGTSMGGQTFYTSGGAVATLSATGVVSGLLGYGGVVAALGGPVSALLPLLLGCRTASSVRAVLSAVVAAVRTHCGCQRAMTSVEGLSGGAGGYRILSFLLHNLPVRIKDANTVQVLFGLAIEPALPPAISSWEERCIQEGIEEQSGSSKVTGWGDMWADSGLSSVRVPVLVDSEALSSVILNELTWGGSPYHVVLEITRTLAALVSARHDPIAAMNAKKLAAIGAVRWLLLTAIRIVSDTADLALFTGSRGLETNSFTDNVSKNERIWQYASRSVAEAADGRDTSDEFFVAWSSALIPIAEADLLPEDVDLWLSLITSIRPAGIAYNKLPSTVGYDFNKSELSIEDDGSYSEAESTLRTYFPPFPMSDKPADAPERQASLFPYCSFDRLPLNSVKPDEQTLSEPSTEEDVVLVVARKALTPYEYLRLQLLRLLLRLDISITSTVSAKQNIASATQNTSSHILKNVLRPKLTATWIARVLSVDCLATRTSGLSLVSHLIHTDITFMREFRSIGGYSLLHALFTGGDPQSCCATAPGGIFSDQDSVSSPIATHSSALAGSFSQTICDSNIIPAVSTAGIRPPEPPLVLALVALLFKLPRRATITPADLCGFTASRPPYGLLAILNDSAIATDEPHLSQHSLPLLRSLYAALTLCTASAIADPRFSSYHQDSVDTKRYDGQTRHYGLRGETANCLLGTYFSSRGQSVEWTPWAEVSGRLLLLVLHTSLTKCPSFQQLHHSRAAISIYASAMLASSITLSNLFEDDMDGEDMDIILNKKDTKFEFFDVGHGLRSFPTTVKLLRSSLESSPSTVIEGDEAMPWVTHALFIDADRDDRLLTQLFSSLPTSHKRFEPLFQTFIAREFCDLIVQNSNNYDCKNGSIFSPYGNLTSSPLTFKGPFSLDAVGRSLTYLTPLTSASLVSPPALLTLIEVTLQRLLQCIRSSSSSTNVAFEPPFLRTAEATRMLILSLLPPTRRGIVYDTLAHLPELNLRPSTIEVEVNEKLHFLSMLSCSSAVLLHPLLEDNADGSSTSITGGVSGGAVGGNISERTLKGGELNMAKADLQKISSNYAFTLLWFLYGIISSSPVPPPSIDPPQWSAERTTYSDDIQFSSAELCITTAYRLFVDLLSSRTSLMESIFTSIRNRTTSVAVNESSASVDIWRDGISLLLSPSQTTPVTTHSGPSSWKSLSSRIPPLSPRFSSVVSSSAQSNRSNTSTGSEVKTSNDPSESWRRVLEFHDWLSVNRGLVNTLFGELSRVLAGIRETLPDREMYFALLASVQKAEISAAKDGLIAPLAVRGGPLGAASPLAALDPTIPTGITSQTIVDPHSLAISIANASDFVRTSLGTWSTDHVRDATAGAMAWQTQWRAARAAPLWGMVEPAERQSGAAYRPRHGQIIWRLSSRTPNLERRLLCQDAGSQPRGLFFAGPIAPTDPLFSLLSSSHRARPDLTLSSTSDADINALTPSITNTHPFNSPLLASPLASGSENRRISIGTSSSRLSLRMSSTPVATTLFPSNDLYPSASGATEEICASEPSIPVSQLGNNSDSLLTPEAEYAALWTNLRQAGAVSASISVEIDEPSIVLSGDDIVDPSDAATVAAENMLHVASGMQIIPEGDSHSGDVDDDEEDDEPYLLSSNTQSSGDGDSHSQSPPNPSTKELPLSSSNLKAPSTPSPQAVVPQFSISISSWRHQVARELLCGLITPTDFNSSAIWNVEIVSGLESQHGVLLFTKRRLHLLAGFVVVNNETSAVKAEFDWIAPDINSDEVTAAGTRSLKRLFSGQIGSFSLNTLREAGPLGKNASFTFDNDDSSFWTTNERLGLCGGGVPEMSEFLRAVWSELAELDSSTITLPLESITSFYLRRYQLKQRALEITSTTGAAVLFSCDSVTIAHTVLDRLLSSVMSAMPHCLFRHMPNLTRLQSALRSSPSSTYARFTAELLTMLSTYWQHGAITNYEYLLHLNALAGRSFLDLTQYPVMPWIVADYKSGPEDFDLNDPATFRDLSLPMGAQDPKRKEAFLERYDTMAAFEREMTEMGETGSPPFHYGTHYSCAGYVLHYLVRLQPYAALSLALQGGSFDRADRLFYDLEASWRSASSENLQDVRELIPEFFTLPDFLVNLNGLDLGVTQKGQRVNDVVLPPWARGDAREFIRLHRAALESRYVSERLHHWVDLVFGYQQRGKAALLATNLFIHITYDGAVDIDAIEHPTERAAVLSQIHHFGQTPSKLFHCSSPKKIVPQLTVSLASVTSNWSASSPTSTNSTSNSVTGSHLSSTLSAAVATPAALTWHENQTPPLCIIGAPRARKLARLLTQTAVFPASFSTSQTRAVGDIRFVSRDKLAAAPLGKLFLPPLGRRFYKFGGTADGVVLQTLPATSAVAVAVAIKEPPIAFDGLHCRPVTAIATSADGEFLATASEDSSVKVWRLVKGRSAVGSLTSASSSNPNVVGHGGNKRSLVAVAAFYGGHESSITCIDLCEQFHLIASGGKDRSVALWDYASGHLVRTLTPLHTSALVGVAINPISGSIVTVTKEQLRVYHVNGGLLAFHNFSEAVLDTLNSAEDCRTTGSTFAGLRVPLSAGGDCEYRIHAATTCLAPACGEWQDGVIAVTGHVNGDVYLWSLDDAPPSTASSETLVHIAEPPPPSATTFRTRALPSTPRTLPQVPMDVDESEAPHMYDGTVVLRRLVPSKLPLATATYGGTQGSNTSGAAISCLRLASPDRPTAVAALRGTYDAFRGQCLLVGDRAGNLSAWSPFKLDALSSEELSDPTGKRI